ncbi:MAG: hypothetical protein GWN40_03065, partial [Nitrosopumilaceae archaeon]|nr:hypothetical protein [Nitrosopumilaceae archaeon]
TAQDINLLSQLLEIASKRNAFQIDEFALVGALYTKLKNFLMVVENTEKSKQKTQIESNQNSKDSTDEEKQKEV